MFEQYTHTLIALPKEFMPTPMQVQDFMASAVKSEYVPTPATCFGRRYTGKTRTVPSPFDNKSLTIEVPEKLDITMIEEVARQIAVNTDYVVGVEGFGKPQHPPLPIAYPEDFGDDDYSITIACRVSKVLRATSHQIDERGNFLQLPPFGHPCDDKLTRGKFTNPMNGKTIEVPEAGCGRFWIEVELGKFMLPPIASNNLDVLDADFVSLTQRIFGIDFVQGCHWG